MSETKGKSAVVMKGLFRIEKKEYNESSGEIVFRADITYNEKFYKDLPILRLHIELDDSDPDDIEVYVDDEYCHMIPYLKPIKKFRDAIVVDLALFFRGYAPLFKAGAMKYLEEIKTFSDLKGLIRQAKASVNRLRPERKGVEKMARDVLSAMNMTPEMDIEFKREM